MKNNLPFDPFDQMKAEDFTSLWNQIMGDRLDMIGGFAFVLGDPRNQDSLTWFNINWKDSKRDAYWVLYELYTGKAAPKNRPKIGQMILEPSSHVNPGDGLKVHVTVAPSNTGKLHYDYLISDIASDPLIVKTAMIFDAGRPESAPGEVTLTAPDHPWNLPRVCRDHRCAEECDRCRPLVGCGIAAHDHALSRVSISFRHASRSVG